ncbi:MAG TPA: cysteine peptidase family C39 domain-containing protein, partial [Polyangiales bacterium]|nr:cysteine peptidase family C39 domain-containing protein [Polyangiales bacterium]
MDCGPAALGCMLSGFGISFDPLQLRALCQTQADGTSIDRLEEVAGELGLEVEQVVVPTDHLLFGSSPLLTTLDLPDGGTHFVVVWRRFGELLQVMDPARGRKWMSRRALLRQLHRVELPVSADAFRSYAGSAAFIAPLRRRLLEHTSRDRVAHMLEDALRDPTYKALSRLDAATRAVSDLGQRGVLRTRRERSALLEHWLRGEQSPVVPDDCFHTLPLSAEPGLSLRGTPALRVVGRAASAETARAALLPLQRPSGQKQRSGLCDLLSVQAKEARWPLPLCIALVALFTLGALQETVLLRSWIELDRTLSDVLQRSGAALCVLAWIAALACFELSLAIGSLRIGRQLETRLRLAFMHKLPRLYDRYFLSRPVSDLADRGHMVHLVRGLPPFGLALSRACFELIGTGCGMVWLDSTSLVRVSMVSALSLLLPLVALRTLTERDRGVRALVSDLGRTYFDLLRGISAVRAHHAEETMSREHARQLTQLARSGRGLARAGVLLEAVVSAVSVAMSGWLFLGYIAAGREPLAGLLYLYWALSLPAHGRTIASLSRQLPGYINVLARIREPLAAREIDLQPTAAVSQGPASLTFEGVELRAGQQTILSDLTLKIAPGEHVAIVGASGAGKSSLLGLLLGWQEP